MGVPVSVPRLIVERLAGAGGLARLTREEAAHARARRLGPGDAVVLFDGSGAEADGRLERFDRAGAAVRVVSLRPAASRPEPPLRLLVAAVRAERLAWIAEKATELGAAAVALIRSDLTQTFRAREAVRPRLERIVREAAKQAQTARWPAIEGPLSLREAVDGETARHRLMLDAEGQAFPRELDGATSLLVGPEGGWTDEERLAARAAGWRPASLPAGKLRTETAAVAALVLARAALARRIAD